MAELIATRTGGARHAFAVYRRSLAAHFRSIVEYPADFWVMASAGALWQTLQFAFLAILFANVSAIAGWGYHEMLVLVGFLTLGGATTAVFWDGVWSIGSMVIKGDIDYRITRPAPVIVQVASLHVGMQAFGELSLGTVMLVYGWVGAGLSPTLIPLALLMLACAVVIETAVLTALCAVNFWVKGTMSVFAFLVNDLQQDVLRFPLGIYPAAVRLVAMFVIPLAFVSFVPVEVLTGRASDWWAFGPPIAAAATAAAAILVVRAGLRSYDSAGH
ncbi:ABC transporter permease [Glycomyces tenuis]|uniref:ABC transporter permease n=1 Tax=Glycomyces tenuis TaxID=58116 RepID=UPI00040F18E6|nr:ABC-2 family transporter protein [Glycomyces tenuis]